MTVKARLIPEEAVVQPGGRPQLAVGIVTTNNLDVLRSCLASLPDGLAGCPPTTVTISDNSSVDGGPDWVRENWEDASIVRGENRGYAAAVNRVFDANPDVDYYLILNPDTTLERGSAAALVNRCEGRVGAVVPKMIEADGELSLSLRRFPTLRTALGESLLGGRLSRRIGRLSEVIGDSAAYTRAGSIDWATGAAVLMTREGVEKAGRWNESFFLYSDETEWFERLHRAGLEAVYEPDARIHHIGGKRLEDPHLWAVLMLNKARAYGLSHSVLRTRAYRTILWVGEAMRAPRAARHRAAADALLRDNSPFEAGGGAGLTVPGHGA